MYVLSISGDHHVVLNFEMINFSRCFLVKGRVSQIAKTALEKVKKAYLLRLEKGFKFKNQRP